MTKRACFVRLPELRLLEHSCLLVNWAFDNSCYLVGSCLKTPDFHDVDIRMIFDDEKFEQEFGPDPGELSPKWSLTCTSISLYLQRQTGLPVDFQIQKRSRVKDEDWEKDRLPLGVFIVPRLKSPEDESAESE